MNHLEIIIPILAAIVGFGLGYLAVIMNHLEIIIPILTAIVGFGLGYLSARKPRPWP